MPNYHILSIDGGGIRGLVSAILMERLEAEIPFLGEVDLFAGTSTGGIIALALAYGYSPEEIRDLYLTEGASVFQDSFLDDLIDLGRLAGADYSLGNLKEALVRRFGQQKLGDLPKKVLISTFDLDNESQDPKVERMWKAKFFHNYPGEDSDEDQLIVDVAMRTAAAPTYFPIYQGYIDGGVVATNPSMCALAQALNLETGNQILEDIVLLSLGTGKSPQFLEEMDADWGLAQWARHLVDIIFEGSAGLADYQCRQALNERYLRINPQLPEPIGLDEVDKLEFLVEIAEREDLRHVFPWLRLYFQEIE